MNAIFKLVHVSKTVSVKQNALHDTAKSYR